MAKGYERDGNNPQLELRICTVYAVSDEESVIPATHESLALHLCLEGRHPVADWFLSFDIL